MKYKETDFNGLFLISHKLFKDERGSFKEVFRKNEIENKLNYKINFCQENIVESKINVLRGLHFQKEPYAQSKLISVLRGSILDVAVDIRRNHKTFGKYFSYVLDANNNESLFIPRGFAHGYLALSESVLIKYSVDNFYNPNMEYGIPYNDNFLNIDWGIKQGEMIISDKDKSYNSFQW